MKKTITMIALAALFVSCAKEAEQTPATTGEVITVAPTEFHATLETPEPDTRTTLGGENYTQVLWEKDDSISVWSGVSNQAKYTLSSGEGTTSATFTSSQTVTGDEILLNVALYPYDKDVVLTEGKGDGAFTNVKYPEVQNYRANSWDKGAMPMFAIGPLSETLSFYNFAGVLRLTLTGTATIDSIKVSALGADEYVSGVFDFDFTNETSFTSGKKTVTLKCGESGVTLSETESTVFNIVIPRLDGGFKVTIFDSEHGVMILQSESEIKRNTILNMPTVSYKPNAMDLGLSVYWATCNVGADTPEDRGDYFAWGETETKDTYSWSTYKWCEGTDDTLTKYNTNSGFGNVDNKTTLEPEDDAATQNCGSAWRIPTIAEFEELCNENNCEWTWINGVKGYRVTSKVEGYTDVSIFLPAAGYRPGDSLDLVGYYGFYWSSSLRRMSEASYLYFYDGYISTSSGSRDYGQSVRPVIE